MISFKPFFIWCASHRITDTELCKRTGISRLSINNMRKYGIFSQASLELICKEFGLNIADVMRYEDD